jgi:hypothetical protein
MKIRDGLANVAFVGMKHEAEDIVDFLAIWLSLAASLLLGATLAIVVGRAEGLWIGVAAGIVTYCAGMRICSFTFLSHPHSG